MPRGRKSDAEAVLDNVEVEDNNEEVVSGEVQHVSVEQAAHIAPPPPRLTDEAWENYVMEQFRPSELESGFPKVHGLRRVVQDLIGPIVESRARLVDAATESNQFTATCEYTVTVLVVNPLALEDGQSPYRKEYTDVSDAGPRNTDLDFAKYAPQVASTRAEGRALRKLIGLSKVAAEEIDRDEGLYRRAVSEDNDKTEIQDSQISYIQVLCARLRISEDRFINLGKEKYNSVKQISYSKAKEMMRVLRDYGSGAKKIPDKIKLDV